MKRKSVENTRSYFKFITLLLLLSFPFAAISKEDISQRKVISYVDTSLSNSQKYVLRVDDKPFYMINVQVRFDKLRYRWGWDMATCEKLLEQTVPLGFNTLSIPIHWVEVEPEKDKFDWSTLDLYLGMAQKYNFKVELLWFGQNSGGHVQWLKPDQLRTPNYVMYSPKAGDFESFSTKGSSKETTSDYIIRRDISDYTLDLEDKKLRAREAFVLNRVMRHIAQWDIENGLKHTVIGIQLNNEVRSFPSSTIVEYMNELGRGVKESPYSVWTRMNCTFADLYSVLYSNEQLRSTTGTYIDFVGIDNYCSTPEAMDNYINSMRTCIPYMGKNYRMIMEAGAEMSNIAQLQLAALSGNIAFDYYELCGPDGRGIFVKDESMHFRPRSKYIEEDVKLVNTMLNGVMTDIALNSNGYGLFVHNWRGESLMPTIGVEDISFKPSYINSQALTIIRGADEIILTTTKGGVFSWNESLEIASANQGYLDANNLWTNEKNIKLHADKKRRTISVTLAAGQTVRLLRKTSQPQPATIYPAELANFGGGVSIEADIENGIGFSGNGYLNFPLAGGYAEWTKVDGRQGGEKTIRIRYANATKVNGNPWIVVNGEKKRINLPITGAWNKYQYISIKVKLNQGTNNIIRLETTWNGAGHIDELQLME